jgi:recombination protein RecA
MAKEETNSKKQALEAALGTIEKQFGAGAIMRMDSSHKLQVESIPTGSIGLDMALGVGGVPRGRIVEIFGSAHYCRGAKKRRYRGLY